MPSFCPSVPSSSFSVLQCRRQNYELCEKILLFSKTFVTVILIWSIFLDKYIFRWFSTKTVAKLSLKYLFIPNVISGQLSVSRAYNLFYEYKLGYLLPRQCTPSYTIEVEWRMRGLMYFFTSRTHSFDDSNPRLARKGKNKKMLSNSTRRVSWHSGLDLVDGLGVLGSIRTGNSPLEVPEGETYLHQQII